VRENRSDTQQWSPVAVGDWRLNPQHQTTQAVQCGVLKATVCLVKCKWTCTCRGFFKPSDHSQLHVTIPSLTPVHTLMAEAPVQGAACPSRLTNHSHTFIHRRSILESSVIPEDRQIFLQRFCLHHLCRLNATNVQWGTVWDSPFSKVF